MIRKNTSLFQAIKENKIGRKFEGIVSLHPVIGSRKRNHYTAMSDHTVITMFDPAIAKIWVEDSLEGTRLRASLLGRNQVNRGTQILSNSTVNWQMRRMIKGFASFEIVDEDAAYFDVGGFNQGFQSVKDRRRGTRAASSTMTKYDADRFNDGRGDRKMKTVGMSEINEAEEDDGCFENDQQQYSDGEQDRSANNSARKITLGYTKSGRNLIEAEVQQVDEQADPAKVNFTIQNPGSIGEPSPINNEAHVAELQRHDQSNLQHDDD